MAVGILGKGVYAAIRFALTPFALPSDDEGRIYDSLFFSSSFTGLLPFIFKVHIVMLEELFPVIFFHLVGSGRFAVLVA